MSIARIAPEKFKFQDLVCVALAFQFKDEADLQVFAEPDGEDAEFRLKRQSGECLKIEVQVKGAQGPVTLQFLAACLAHYPERKSEGCLLQRLVESQQTLHLILVMSGRCDDSASRFVSDLPEEGGLPTRLDLRDEDAQAMLSTLRSVDLAGDGTSDLKNSRHADFSSRAQSLGMRQLKRALERVVVIERFTEFKCEQLCAFHLITAYRLMRDRVPEAMGALREVIDSHRGDGTDFIPTMRLAIARLSPKSCMPKSYVRRGDEARWLKKLADDNVLLLTGPPRIGKSFLARRLVSEYEQQGYYVAEFNSLESADRFLSQHPDTGAVVLVDDPLGSTHTSINPERSLGQLSSFLRNLKECHKVVVTQSRDQLLFASRAGDISGLVTAGARWTELPNPSAIFLSDLWMELTCDSGVPEELRELVRSFLNDERLEVEPGCLDFLASCFDKLEGDYSYEKVLRLARKDALDLGRALAAEMELLATTLAIATTKGDAIGQKELAFGLGAGGDELPGLGDLDDLGFTITFGDSQNVAPTLKYSQTPELADAYDQQLETLERRGWIRYSGTGETLNLSHPFYRAAMEANLDDPRDRLSKKVLAIAKRTLFSAKPSTSKAVARNLHWMHSQNGRDDYKAALRELATLGLKSRFPGTRDLCLLFLTSNLHLLSKEMLADLPNWAYETNHISLEYLTWTDGEAVLPDGRFVEVDPFASQRVRREDVSETLDAIALDHTVYISSERATKLLLYLRRNPSSMTLSMLEAFLHFDEAVLRAEAVESWIKESRSGDDEALARVFSDTHPKIASALLTGLCKGWKTLPNDRRKQILDGLEGLSSELSPALAVLSILVRFGTLDSPFEVPIEAYTQLVPVAFNQLPLGGLVNSEKFHFSVNKAAPFLPQSAAQQILESWLRLIKLAESTSELPDDYFFGIIDFLVAAKNLAPVDRENAVSELILLESTAFKIRFVADLAFYWRSLTSAEHQWILEKIGESEHDQCWLKAAALLRDPAPAELGYFILGPGLSLDSDRDAVVSALGADAYNAALHLYCCSNSIFHSLGFTPIRGHNFWLESATDCALDFRSLNFEMCTEVLVSCGQASCLLEIIANTEPDRLEQMFSMLLRLSVCYSTDLSTHWQQLLVKADRATRQRWFDLMAAAAPCIVESLDEIATLWPSVPRWGETIRGESLV